MVGHFDETIARARPLSDCRSRPAFALLRQDSWRRVQKWLYYDGQVRVGWVRRTVRGDGTAARVREMVGVGWVRRRVRGDGAAARVREIVRVGWVRRTVRGEARLQAAEKTDVGFGKSSACRLTGRKG